LERRILKKAGIDSGRTIVELGAGLGGTTRAILRAMPPDARLLSIEINPRFHALLNRIEDDRLIAHLGSACDLKEIISRYELDPPEVVISGIPFSMMSHDSGSRVLDAISGSLAPNGRFVAYQVSRRVALLSRPFLGPERSAVELLNLPPMRVFMWKKNGIRHPAASGVPVSLGKQA
ncbi:MAG: methyltransferase type 12, partial [Nitrospinaceae bacterium]|nr:methyltransferase type 12 [Nitrospinaceae bacterium]NIR56940.1 methyltransferase type 12 [Nitrospinaceae bacterium]NIS87396.1 methyltransferase type 12 [Nitrospinaceae bacterium]NIT84248.1 methyltransferase type 12 [Nitrospinaceae bacterium]NIU46436.1 methyltransferase type 12 [Nitrospinaceae bacterium]